MSKITVLGAGSWGTALAKTLSLTNQNVWVWGRDKNQIDDINKNHMNSKYLDGVNIPESITFTFNINNAIEGAEVIIFSVSSQANRKILEDIKDFVNKKTILVNVSKGLEKSTNKRGSEIFKEILPNNPFVALSGPSHAEEVAINIPTTLVASSDSKEAMEYIQKAFSNEYMRVYTNKDVIGVELGGALKNIIALGIGILDGLGYGDNTKAAMMTRGMTEIVRFSKVLGADEKTFFGLTGIGDLIVTCTSEHSRNRKAGYLIGKGKTLEELQKDINMVVEGIVATNIIYNMSNELDIEMPIVSELYKILYENKDVKEAIKTLMVRKTKYENEDSI